LTYQPSPEKQKEAVKNAEKAYSYSRR